MDIKQLNTKYRDENLIDFQKSMKEYFFLFWLKAFWIKIKMNN